MIQTQLVKMNKNLPPKQPQKASKASEFVDTSADDKQEPQPEKAPNTPEYSGDEQEPVVNYQRCIVMYSTEEEQ